MGPRALVNLVHDLFGADADRVDEFIRYGVWLNVAAVMGIQARKDLHEWARGRSALAPYRREHDGK